MIPRSILIGLLLGVAVFLVAFAVVMGGYALASGTGDTGAAAVFWYLGMALLALLAIVLILLICALALAFVGPRRGDAEESEEE